jgi:hypothetical protein
MREIPSGLASATRFGTSSPITTEASVIATTTSENATRSAYGASGSACAIQAARRSFVCSPAAAPWRIVISVIPTCTAERKRSGRSASSSARRAFLSPPSASSRSRVLRAEMSAVSDMEKKPFASRSARMTRNSGRIACINLPRASMSSASCANVF